MRLRKSNFPKPPRDFTERQSASVHPAILQARESAVAFLNAEHAKLDGRPFDLATEKGTGCASAETEIVESAPGAPAREA